MEQINQFEDSNALFLKYHNFIEKSDDDPSLNVLLPTEIIMKIFNYASSTFVSNLRLTCRIWEHYITKTSDICLKVRISRLSLLRHSEWQNTPNIKQNMQSGKKIGISSIKDDLVVVNRLGNDFDLFCQQMYPQTSEFFSFATNALVKQLSENYILLRESGDLYFLTNKSVDKKHQLVVMHKNIKDNPIIFDLKIKDSLVCITDCCVLSETKIVIFDSKKYEYSCWDLSSGKAICVGNTVLEDKEHNMGSSTFVVGSYILTKERVINIDDFTHKEHEIGPFYTFATYQSSFFIKGNNGGYYYITDEGEVKKKFDLGDGIFSRVQLNDKFIVISHSKEGFLGNQYEDIIIYDTQGKKINSFEKNVNHILMRLVGDILIFTDGFKEIIKFWDITKQKYILELEWAKSFYNPRLINGDEQLMDFNFHDEILTLFIWNRVSCEYKLIQFGDSIANDSLTLNKDDTIWQNVAKMTTLKVVTRFVNDFFYCLR